MSEEIPELGEIAYVGYFKASDGKSLVSGAPLPAWDEQEFPIRQAWNLAAMAVVDRWSEPGDDDPEPKPEPAKVIIVTERHGDTTRERRYDAGQADGDDYGRLMLLRRGRPVAGFQPNGCLGWRKDDALVPDSTVRALGIARRALEAVTRISDPNVAIKLAGDALDEIFAETE